MAAQGLGITLYSMKCGTQADLTMAFLTLSRRERTDAMIVEGDPLLVPNRRSIVEFTASRRLPAIYGAS